MEKSTTSQNFILVPMTVSEYRAFTEFRIRVLSDQLTPVQDPAPEPDSVPEQGEDTTPSSGKDIRKGLAGICDLFNCSQAMAFKIAHEEWFRPALLPVAGRRIIFDADVALELAHKLNYEIKPAA